MKHLTLLLAFSIFTYGSEALDIVEDNSQYMVFMNQLHCHMDDQTLICD